MQTERLKVTGMTCSGCTSKVSQALNGINGVSDVDVSLAAGEATVKFDEWLTSPDQLKSTIESVGHGGHGSGGRREEEKPAGKDGKPRPSKQGSDHQH